MPSKPPSKKIKVFGRKGAYSHNYDPYTTFSTQAEARQDASRLKAAGGKPRSPRTPTFYTVLQYKQKGKIDKLRSVPQGPHVVPHFFVYDKLISGRSNRKYLRKIASTLPDANEYQNMVDSEVGPGHVKSLQAAQAIVLYQKRYKKIAGLLRKKNTTELEDVTLVHTINKAIQLNPYGTYAYLGKGAGKRALKGKGERRDKPIKEQIDWGKFKDGDAGKAYIKTWVNM